MPLGGGSSDAERLAGFSRVHAPLMLAACLAGAVLGQTWPLGATAATSFGVLLVLARDLWGGRFVMPNAVTAVRLAIVLGAALAFHGGDGVVWVAAVGVAFALDGVDGWLARRAGATSAFGAYFDMETDALIALVVSFELWARGRLGAWVLAGGLLRYAYVVWVSLVPPAAGEMPRSKFGRRAFVVLVIGLSLALASPSAVAAAAAAIGTAAVTISFARSFYWAYFRRFEVVP